MEENSEIEYSYQDFLDALSARDFKLAEKIGLEIGQEIPVEYLDDLVHELNTDIADEITLKQTSKPTYDKIYITNQTSESEVLKTISKNASNKIYSVFVFSEKPKFKQYQLAKEDAFSYYNFEDPKDAEGVKDLYKSAIYYARGYLNNNTAAIMQENTKQIKYHVLKSVIDKDGEIRPELPRVKEEEIPLNENLELMIEEGNFQRPGLLLPTANYDWKKEIIKKD